MSDSGAATFDGDAMIEKMKAKIEDAERALFEAVDRYRAVETGDEQREMWKTVNRVNISHDVERLAFALRDAHREAGR